MERPLACAARRTRAIVSPCASCVPCEKLKRKTSTPASISSPITRSELDAGPSVAMIFVFRKESPGLGSSGYSRSGK